MARGESLRMAGAATPAASHLSGDRPRLRALAGLSTWTATGEVAARLASEPIWRAEPSGPVTADTPG
jgi:hypothetical protein